MKEIEVYTLKKCEMNDNIWEISIKVDVDEIVGVDFDEYSGDEKESIFALAFILKRMGVVA